MTKLLTTFHVGPHFYGIEVMSVQEVTGQLPVITIPLAPSFVRGLINLRGQIATALGLRELLGINESRPADEASVVCKFEGSLVSLIVDTIGDVIEVEDSQFEKPPEIVPNKVRKFLKGVYKIDGCLLSVLDLEKLFKEISSTPENIEI